MDSQNILENQSASVGFTLRTANSMAEAPADKQKEGGGRRTVLFCRKLTSQARRPKRASCGRALAREG